MNTVKDDGESESSSSAAPCRRIDACEGDEDEEESMVGTVLHVSLHTPPSTSPPKGEFTELKRTFSAITWCAKTGLIACATEVCAKDARSSAPLLFWIPIHIIHPERPTEHAVFNVNADSLCDYIQFLEWSPASCTRALLVATMSGRVTIWMQPLQAAANAAQALNSWKCEHEWQQDPAIITKWLSGGSPYRWSSTPTSGLSKPSFEERFISHQFRAPVRWPNFLCVCSVTISGYVRVHWCQWPPVPSRAKQNWFATKRGVLGARRMDLISADVIVSEAGSLLVAGVPVGNSSTVVVWEVCPLIPNSQGSSQQTGVASWPGIASLPSALLSWHDGSENDSKPVTDGGTLFSGMDIKPQTVPTNQRLEEPLASIDEMGAPVLQCSVTSSLSACRPLETDVLTTTGWGSGASAVAFDPSKGGSTLVVLLNEGRNSLPFPDEGPAVNGYRVQRWESSMQQIGLHPLFEPLAYSSTSPSTSTTIWRSTSDKAISTIRKEDSSFLQSTKMFDEALDSTSTDQPPITKTCSKIVFSAHGGELAVVTPAGDVHLYSGPNLIPIDNYSLKVEILCAAQCFSPTGCCVSTVWHDIKNDCTVLKILRVFPPAFPIMQGAANNNSSWERGLADRLWWSLIVAVDWWDVVGCIQSAVEENLVTFLKVIAVLDSDFHSLPLLSQRQHYGPALDRIKCRMLEGVEGSDVRAVVLDMQARLLLEMLGKGIEAALVNPATFIAEPWITSSETFTGLVHDVMTVEPALVSYIEPYIDAVLDLASHFLTRLRRYASFCRTLATHAAGNQSLNASNTRLPNTSANAAGSNAAPSQGPQATTTTTNGTSSVQAWVQGAIAKVNNSTDGAVSLTTSGATGTVPPLQLSVSQAAFPGMPAVRLVGECNFIHRLCQLLLFCFISRRRQQPRGVPTATRNLDAMDGSEDPGGVRSGRLGRSYPSGNAGQGYTLDEVRYLFQVSVTLCKKTSSLPHPMPKSQSGSPTPLIRLHHPDGQYSVPPEVVEASLGQQIQHLPRPRGADSAGLLMRELELHPPAEDWTKRNLFGGPWTGGLELCLPSDEERRAMAAESQVPVAAFLGEEATKFRDLWPRKRRFSERDTAFGLSTAVSMGNFTSFMGSKRDTITAVWKNSPLGVWHKCIRCGRQTGALTKPNSSVPSNPVDAWWTGRYIYACPICGGPWVQVV